MSKPVTHRLVYQDMPVPNSSVPMRTARLYRESDGMLTVTVKDALVQFGEDPQHGQMRVFLSHDHALKFARKLADRDWAVTSGLNPSDPDFISQVERGYVANIAEEHADRRIVSPDQNQILALKN